MGGTRVYSGTVSKLNQKVYKHIEAWRNRPIEGTYPYVYLDGIVLKRSWAGAIKNVSVLVAVGVDEEGYRRILGIAEGHMEDKAGWSGFWLTSQAARAERRQAGHLRCLHGLGGIGRRLLS